MTTSLLVLVACFMFLVGLVFGIFAEDASNRTQERLLPVPIIVFIVALISLGAWLF